MHRRRRNPLDGWTNGLLLEGLRTEIWLPYASECLAEYSGVLWSASCCAPIKTEMICQGGARWSERLGLVLCQCTYLVVVGGVQELP
jgi:hypothetical protein